MTLTADAPVDPSALAPLARKALAHTLFHALQDRIFRGVDFPAFQKMVVDSPARTRIQILRKDGQPVGYTAVHVYDWMLDGTPTLIMRCETGLLPEHRGQSAIGAFFAAEIARLCARHPFRRKLFFACPVHPSSFLTLTRNAPGGWPRPGLPVPPEVSRQMELLADAFGLPTTPAADPHVRQVGWITRQTADEARHWANHPAPEVKLYLERNPGYTEGRGLMVLIPLTPLALVSGYLQHWAHRTLRSLRRGGLLMPVTA